MARLRFSDSLYQAELMLAGIMNHQVVLAGRGMDVSFVDELTKLHGQVKTMDQVQETLKAQLKSQTEQLLAAQEILNTKLAEAKKRIKLDIPQTRWKEFGIADSR